MLILTTQYFFDMSWVRAAESLGWKTATVPSAMVGGITTDQLRQLFTVLAEFKPDFILTSNFSGMDALGIFGRFVEDARIPYVSWFTDTPRMILYERVVHCSYYTVAATWERAYEPHLRDLGFQHVFFMPHATDPFLFHGTPASVPERPVAFVGTSMIKQAEEAWDVLEESADLFDAVRCAFEEGRVTRESFARGVETIIDAELLSRCDARQRRHVELCIVYEGTRRMREALVRTLAPINIEVRGDAEWGRIHGNVDGDLNYFKDLAPYYRSTAVNVNVTSLQMCASVNQRVFDCPAAGGFLLTDAQSDLHELFEVGTEAVTYETFEELADKTRHFLRRPDLRRAVIEKAQRRIAAQHTHAHRLLSLEAFLKERYAKG